MQGRGKPANFSLTEADYRQQEKVKEQYFPWLAGSSVHCILWESTLNCDVSLSKWYTTESTVDCYFLTVEGIREYAPMLQLVLHHMEYTLRKYFLPH